MTEPRDEQNIPPPEGSFPDEAAEMFTGLVLGHAHLRSMLNVPQIDDERRAHRAREAARIFLTAYAPTLDQAR